MSLQHFINQNKKRIEEDYETINSQSEFIPPEIQSVKLDDWKNYFEKIFVNNDILQKYWIYRLELYHSTINETRYPLINSSQNLINVNNLYLYLLESCHTEDTLTIYFVEGYIEFKVESTIDITYSDGISYQFVFHLEKDENNLMNRFYEIMDNENECSRLGEQNEFWKIIYENKGFEENYFRSNLTV